MASHLCGAQRWRHTHAAAAAVGCELPQGVGRGGAVLAAQRRGIMFQLGLNEDVGDALALAADERGQGLGRGSGGHHLHLGACHGVARHAEPHLRCRIHQHAQTERAPRRYMVAAEAACGDMAVGINHVDAEHGLVLRQPGRGAAQHGFQRVVKLARVEALGDEQRQLVGQSARRWQRCLAPRGGCVAARPCHGERHSCSRQ